MGFVMSIKRTNRFRMFLFYQVMSCIALIRPNLAWEMITDAEVGADAERRRKAVEDYLRRNKNDFPGMKSDE